MIEKVLFLFASEYILIMKIIRAFFAFILIFCAAFTVFVGKDKLNENNPVVTPSQYKGVITLWQIDSFEGGKGSRKQFLLSVSRNFEKENKGVLIMVISHTKESAEKAMEEGNYPDMISYGAGVDVVNMSEIKTSKRNLGGLVGDKSYAVSWCRGGYALFSNPKLTGNNGGENQGEESEKKITEIDDLIVSQSAFTQPLAALALEEITAKKAQIFPPLEAYTKFVSGKIPYFLGTQRDIFRLNVRGFEFDFQPLETFNDLYQYISITATDTDKRFYCQEFIDYLISEKVQSRLNEIGMFSSFYQTSYELNELTSMQTIVGFKTISAFMGNENLKQMQAISKNAACGNLHDLNKLKTLLV